MGKYSFYQLKPVCSFVYKHINSETENRIENKVSHVYRLMYIINGSCELEMNNEVLQMSKGDLVYMIPGQVYTTNLFDNTSAIINVFFDYVTEKNQLTHINESFIEGIRDFSKVGKKTHISDVACLNNSFYMKSVDNAIDIADNIYIMNTLKSVYTIFQKSVY